MLFLVSFSSASFFPLPREREKSPKFNVTTLSASLVSCKERGQKKF